MARWVPAAEFSAGNAAAAAAEAAAEKAAAAAGQSIDQLTPAHDGLPANGHSTDQPAEATAAAADIGDMHTMNGHSSPSALAATSAGGDAPAADGPADDELPDIGSAKQDTAMPEFEAAVAAPGIVSGHAAELPFASAALTPEQTA